MLYLFDNFDSVGIYKLKTEDYGMVIDSDDNLMYFYITVEYPNEQLMSIRDLIDTGHYIEIESEDLPDPIELYGTSGARALTMYRAAWGVGGNGGIGRQFNPNNPHSPLGIGAGEAGGTFAGKGGSGGNWGLIGQTGTVGTLNGSVGLNNGRTAGGLSIVGWNTYALPGSILGNQNGGVS